MKEIFDEFPSNINETKGKIERNSFIFESTSYIVYQGIVVKSEKVNLRIIGTISDNLIFVKIKNNPIPNFINDTFNFGEISHSLDRVI